MQPISGQKPNRKLAKSCNRYVKSKQLQFYYSDVFNTRVPKFEAHMLIPFIIIIDTLARKTNRRKTDQKAANSSPSFGRETRRTSRNDQQSCRGESASKERGHEAGIQKRTCRCIYSHGTVCLTLLSQRRFYLAASACETWKVPRSGDRLLGTKNSFIVGKVSAALILYRSYI